MLGLFDVTASSLRQCRSLSEVRRLHKQLCPGIQHPETLVGNMLVQAYASNGGIEEAIDVFVAIRRKNVFSWSILVGGFARCAMLLEAELALDRMPEHSLVAWNAALQWYAQTGQTQLATPKLERHFMLLLHLPGCLAMTSGLRDVVTWNAAISADPAAFDKMPQWNRVSWNAAIQALIHDVDLVKSTFDRSPQRDLVTWTMMLSACVQADEALLAERIFERMPEHGVVAWNSMITAYAETGQVRQSLTMFDVMHQRTVLSWNTMMQGLLLRNRLEEAESMFRRMPQTDPVSWNSMLTAYAQARDEVSANRLFEQMPCRNSVSWNAILQACSSLADAKLVFDSSPERNAQTWTLLLTAYAQEGYLVEAQQVYRKMARRDAVAETAMLRAYAKNEDILSAKEVFDSMAPRDSVAWNAMMAAYAQSGHYTEALNLFAEMDLEGLRPNSISSLIAVEACSSLFKLAAAGSRCKALEQEICLSSVSVSNALATMYAKSGQLSHARRIFEDLSRQRDLMSWNSMITATAQTGDSIRALYLWRSMVLEGLSTNSVTALSGLFACSHSGTLRTGWEIFLSLQGDYSIRPSLEHFVCMIDLLARSGQRNQATELAETMPFEPDETTRLALTAHECEVHGSMVF